MVRAVQRDPTVMSAVTDKEHRKFATRMREVMATYEKQKDLILLGAYEKGTDPRVDYAIDKIGQVTDFLKQPTDEKVSFEETAARLKAMFAA